MKTTTALLEFFVPGCLLFFAIAIIFVAGQQISPRQLLTAASHLLKSEGSVQMVLGLIVLSGSYGLGAISANVAGYVIKPYARGVQEKTIREYLPFLDERGLLQMGSMVDADGERVRGTAAYLRALCAQSCPTATEQMQFHSDQARMLRAFLVPAAMSGIATLVAFGAYDFPTVWLTIALYLSFVGIFYVAADSYSYRQKLLVSTAIDHLIAAADLGTIARRGGTEQVDLLVGVDEANKKTFPINFRVAHKYGVRHRVMHMEVVDANARVLAWKRKDGRLELPGGHVAWGIHGEEEPRYAATRELLEELGLETDEIAARSGRLAKAVELVTWQMSESNDGDNREWVGIARVPIEALGAVKLKEDGAMSDEKNHDPVWMSPKEIRAYTAENPEGFNSSIRLFLERTPS